MLRSSSKPATGARTRSLSLPTLAAVAALTAAALLAVAALPAAAGAAVSVYWAQEDLAAKSSGAIFDAPLGGMPSELFAEAEEAAPEGISLDPATGAVYWSSPYAKSIEVGGIGGALEGSAKPLFEDVEAVGVVVDQAAGKIFWAELAGKIMVAGLGGAAEGPPTTLFEGEGTLLGLAVDPAAGKIYWADKSSGEIRAGNIGGEAERGGEATTLFQGEVEPVGIAVDPVNGRVYWTDANESGVGEVRAGGLGGEAQGEKAETLFEEPSAIPYGVALDPATGRVYWSDYASGLIRSGPIGGESDGEAETVATVAKDGPNQLALLGSPVPLPVAEPAILELASVGGELSCEGTGAWEGDQPAESFYEAPRSFSYQWLRDGSAILGATGKSVVTTEPGEYRCSVIATNAAGSTTEDLGSVDVVGPPTATISSPPSGGSYQQGASVPTSFSCAMGEDGLGLKSCDDSAGTNTASGGTGHLDTSTLGAHTYTVTATNGLGETGSASISYAVVSKPVPKLGIESVGKVSASGKLRVKLACSNAAACAGKLTLTTKDTGAKAKHAKAEHANAKAEHANRTKSKPAKAQAVVLGRVSYRIAAGETETVTLKLSKRALKLLKAAKHGRLAATLAGTVSEGSSVDRAITLKLAPAKKTHAR